MADDYTTNQQFILINSNRQRRQWMHSKTIFLISVITLPLIIFCGIYMIILNGNDALIYPKSSFQAYSNSVHRAKLYNSHSKKWSEPDYNLTSSEKSDPHPQDEFKLVCYYNFPSSASDLPPDKIDAFLCTHLNLAFLTIGPNGTLILTAEQSQTLKSLVKLKKDNAKLRILISVGGAGNDQGFPLMISTHATRKHFIHSVVQLIKSYRIDGVDLDWEFPSSEQSLHFTQLLEEFRAVINRQQEKHRFLLSLAAPAPAFLVDSAYKVPYIDQFVDYVNLMSYDYHFYTKFTPFTGLNAPLFAAVEDGGYFSNLNMNFSAFYWKAKGLARSKIVVGVPTYGHTFRLMNIHNNGLYAPARGFGKLGSNGFADYGQVCEFLHANQIESVFNIEAKSPYAFKGSEWVSYENEQSVSFKSEYVRDARFGGVMIYALNSDDWRGVCQIGDKKIVTKVNFTLTRKVAEILDKNYSLL